MKKRRAGPMRFDRRHADAPRHPQQRVVVGEQAREHVRRRGQHHRVEAAPAGIALQHQFGADVLTEPGRLHQGLGQRRGALQPQVQALARDGVDAVRRIPSSATRGPQNLSASCSDRG
jgi:hypothetical protein